MLIPADSTSQFTILKRPVLVWLFTLYFSYGVVQGLLHLLSGLEFLNLSSDMYSIRNNISLILIFPQLIFLIYFFNLRKSSLKWLYISFGPAIVMNIVFYSWVSAVVMALISWVIWDYVSHKTVNSEPVFN